MNDLAILLAATRAALIHVRYHKRGGMRFLRLGRINISWSVSRMYRPLSCRQERRVLANVERALRH